MILRTQHLLRALLAIAVAPSLVLGQATPTPVANASAVPAIPPGTSFQWQLNQPIDTSFHSRVYDIDLFDTPANVISALKTVGHVVICYFSAGSYENWRPDISSFPGSVRGKGLSGWRGETWLDIRQLSVLGPIMKSRMQLGKSKGCDGVEPDNVDAYSNPSGFALTAADQLTYNRWLADTAHSLNMIVGLKNCGNLSSDLVSWFDFAIVEQCVQFKECDKWKTFTSAGKAVFDVEYTDYSATSATTCPVTNPLNIDAQIKALEVKASRTMCRTDYTDLVAADVPPVSGAAGSLVGRLGWAPAVAAVSAAFVLV